MNMHVLCLIYLPFGKLVKNPNKGGHSMVIHSTVVHSTVVIGIEINIRSKTRHFRRKNSQSTYYALFRASFCFSFLVEAIPEKECCWQKIVNYVFIAPEVDIYKRKKKKKVFFLLLFNFSF